MSDYKAIDEVLYEIDGLQIEKRKKNPLPALMVTLIGVIVIVSVYTIEAISSNANLSSALLFTGFVIALAGIIKAITCFTGKGTPYYTPKNCKLRRYEFFHDQNMRDKVRSCVSEGNFEALGSIPAGDTSAIMSVIYKSDDDDVAVAQVLEYVPHYYRPLTDILIFPQGKFIKSSKLR